MLGVSQFRAKVRVLLGARRALLLALTALGLILLLGSSADAASTASISGSVTDSHGSPITTQDMCVSAYPQVFVGNIEDEPTVKTDASGNYAISGLAPGTYYVYFADCEGSTRNDQVQYYDDQPDYESATTVTLSEGQAQTGVDASMAPATTISGNVYAGSATSTPLEGICVYASPSPGGTVSPPSVKTGAGGAYTITHVVPDVGYEVEFYDCGSKREYLVQYYDGTEEYASATIITSSIATPSTGIDAHLEKGASISGSVTDSSGHAITSEDVCVYASGANVEFVGPTDSYGEAKTDAAGQYTISGLPAGSYKVYFADCYGSTRDDAGQYYYHEASPAFAEPVVLSATQALTGIDASLETATTVSGHVYAGSGSSTPLEGICVYAYTVGGGEDYSSASVETNTEGAYTLTHIVPGIGYDVEFYDCSSNGEYLTQYYYDAATFTSATTITPTIDSPLTGVDAHMQKGASISGTVTDSNGKPITTPEVCVDTELQSSNGSSYSDGYATVDSSGNYSIKGLAAGSYKVYFYDCGAYSRNDLSQYYDGSRTAAGASLVVLSAGGAETGIDASMQPAATISGHVYGTADSSTPLKGICVEAYPISSSEYQLDQGATTGADGSYTIDHLTPSGEYRVDFTDCNTPRRYLGQYYDGAGYASATIVTPTLASPPTDIDAHLEKGASISGTVTDSQGKPITTRDICVSVYPSSYSYNENGYGYATTDSSGNYTVGGLEPGSYHVEFADCEYTTTRNDIAQYYNNQSAPGSAEALTLTAMQERTGIDASLQPATSISGHVYGTSDTSTPLQNICVEAVSSTDEYEVLSSIIRTAADGSYKLLHLVPSTGYKVKFYDCENPSAYEAQFYEGAGEFSSAKTVTPSANPTTGIDAHLVKNPLQVIINSGPADGASSNATDASFAFSAEAANATFECQLDGGAFTPCGSPLKASTLNGGAALANGPHSFSVQATAAGKTGPVTTVYWTIDTSGPTSTSGGSTPAGGTFSSAPGQSLSDTTPVITEVTVPVAAQITLTNEPNTTPSENGYTVFGQQIRIAATGNGNTPVVATPADPIALTFSLNATEIPAGTDLADVTVLRNGVPAGNCTNSGAAEPDPCVESRTALSGGGVKLTVLTTHCSLWNFALSSAPATNPKSGESGEQVAPQPIVGPTPSGTNSPAPAGNQGPSGSAVSGTASGGALGTTTTLPRKPLTRAQKLAKAITLCEKLKKSRRKKCIAAAKKRYAPIHSSKHKKPKR